MNKKELIALLEQLDVPDDTPIVRVSGLGMEKVLDLRSEFIRDQFAKAESFTAIVID